MTRSNSNRTTVFNTLLVCDGEGARKEPNCFGLKISTTKVDFVNAFGDVNDTANPRYDRNDFTLKGILNLKKK